jgi:hypothetical protein
VRVEVPIQPTEVPSCLVCGPELFRVLCSPCAVDRPELYGFGPGFPYKPGQLFSSNKNSGKLLLSPSVNFFYEIQDFRWSSWPLLIPEKN